jgi:uncharacterized membrane protein
MEFPIWNTRIYSTTKNVIYFYSKTKFYIIKSNLVVFVAVVAVVVVSVSPHLGILWKKNLKKIKKINFETSRGLLMCYIYTREANEAGGRVASCVFLHRPTRATRHSII